MVTFKTLPQEMQDSVARHLSELEDVKNFRLVEKACAYTGGRFLPMKRIYLSPHSRDIAAFQELILHQLYREKITELVWDDTIYPTVAARERLQNKGDQADASVLRDALCQNLLPNLRRVTFPHISFREKESNVLYKSPERRHWLKQSVVYNGVPLSNQAWLYNQIDSEECEMHRGLYIVRRCFEWTRQIPELNFHLTILSTRKLEGCFPRSGLLVQARNFQNFAYIAKGLRVLKIKLGKEDGICGRAGGAFQLHSLVDYAKSALSVEELAITDPICLAKLPPEHLKKMHFENLRKLTFIGLCLPLDATEQFLAKHKQPLREVYLVQCTTPTMSTSWPIAKKLSLWYCFFQDLAKLGLMYDELLVCYVNNSAEKPDETDVRMLNTQLVTKTKTTTDPDTGLTVSLRKVAREVPPLWDPMAALLLQANMRSSEFWGKL